MAKSAPRNLVDEIDAIGRTRVAAFGGGQWWAGNDFNQIMVEMDGFEPNDKVIVMAATNRRMCSIRRWFVLVVWPKVLLDLPDRADREEYLKSMR